MKIFVLSTKVDDRHAQSFKSEAADISIILDICHISLRNVNNILLSALKIDLFKHRKD